MIPLKLVEWTYTSIQELCASGESESDRHDFKLGLPDSKGITKICCAFANTFGGFLVVGIRDHGRQFEIEGVPPDTELYGKLTGKVRADPNISISQPLKIPIPESENVVYVFEIPQSPRRPHLPSPDDARIFWKRQGSSCVQMTLEEVRYQMSNYEEKREKIALLLIELSHIVRSLHEQQNLEDGHYDGIIFSFNVIDRVVVESYSILKDDLNTIVALDTLKKRLMLLNAEKQRLLSIMSQAFMPEAKRQEATQYKGLVNRLTPEIFNLSDQIERSIDEKFGIKNPYKLPI